MTVDPQQPPVQARPNGEDHRPREGVVLQRKDEQPTIGAPGSCTTEPPTIGAPTITEDERSTIGAPGSCDEHLRHTPAGKYPGVEGEGGAAHLPEPRGVRFTTDSRKATQLAASARPDTGIELPAMSKA
jgi:hypothetical protein